MHSRVLWRRLWSLALGLTAILHMRFRLWHARNARSLRVLWTLEECGLQRSRDYELVTLPFPPRAHAPEFLDRNPLGTVPWFEHVEPNAHAGGTPALVAAMSESCAVPMYLVDLLASTLGVQPHERCRGAYLNWLHHADAR